MIVFKHDEQGGFYVGDTKTTLTSYAYPTSPYATESLKAPEKIGAAMLKTEQWRKSPNTEAAVREYDRRNWEKLNS